MIEEESTHENSEVIKLINRFIELRNRFISELSSDNQQGADVIISEVEDITVEALVNTGGHPDIMTALDDEFASPIIRKVPAHSIIPAAIRIMFGEIATKAVQKLSKGKEE